MTTSTLTSTLPSTPAVAATTAATATRTGWLARFPTWLAAQQHRAFTGLRILAGLLFAFHGAQLLFGWYMPPGVVIELGSQVWFGGIIELTTGLLLAAGIGARAAAFLASGTMAVAYVQFHWQLALDARVLPSVNQGELALVYAALFLYIACRGVRR